MDRIELSYTYTDRFTLDEIRHELNGQEYRDIRCRIMVNGTLLNDRFEVDLKQLAKSTHESGEFMIFTWRKEWPDIDTGCPPDDAPSIPVIITHSRLKLSWKVPDPVNISEFDLEDQGIKLKCIKYVFDKDQYINAIKTCIENLKMLVRGYRSFCHFRVRDFDEWDLLKLEID